MNTAVAHKMFDAIAANDMKTFRTLFTEDFVLWHSFDLVERKLEQVVSDLSMMLSVVKNVNYVDREFFDIPNGIVGQYRHTGTAITGKPVTLHVMLRFHLAADGRIRRIDEYVESTECAVIMEAAMAAQK